MTTYDATDQYDKCYISKVFTATPVPDDILDRHKVVCGGTGFYYDKAEPLPYDIEHIMPDYNLYDAWIDDMIRGGRKSPNSNFIVTIR